MKRISILAMAAIAVCAIALMTFAATRTDDEAAPIFGIKIPPGYRDWKLISVAHEEGNLNDLRAVLGNDAAIKAYREGKLPFPDGTTIARLAWSYVPSEENNKVFGRQQSFVAGSATNVQFMVKDSQKYASTGGWGFAQFKDGKPDDKADLKTVSLATCLLKLATTYSLSMHPHLRYWEMKNVDTLLLKTRPLFGPTSGKPD